MSTKVQVTTSAQHDAKLPVISRFVIHKYADDEGDMSECGRGFFADVSFENGTSDNAKVTCKQCLKSLAKNGL